MATAKDPTTTNSEDKKTIYDFASKDGTFRRQISSFRNWISPDPAAEFPAEIGRYVCIPSLCDLRHSRPVVDPIQGTIHQPGMSMGCSRKSCQIAEEPRGCHPTCNDGFGHDGGWMVCLFFSSF